MHNYREMTGPHGRLARRLHISGNTMWAQRCQTLPIRGSLNDEEYARLVYDFADPQWDMYVVYSYDTPIAWGNRFGPLYVTSQRFSVTTSKQQSYCRAWINHLYQTANV